MSYLYILETNPLLTLKNHSNMHQVQKKSVWFHLNEEPI